MPSKEIICLAYSRKDGGSCFAGIDLAARKWVRATGAHPNGALADNDCFMQDAAGKFVLPRILDVIEIDFSHADRSLHQPENWKISGAEFRLLRRAGADEFEMLRQTPVDDPELFRGYERLIAVEDLESRPPEYSLALVRPSTLRWHPELDGYRRKRFRGTFGISGATYSLPLTDDEFAARLSKQEDQEGTSRCVSTSNDLLLTISLGDLFHGSYYKLIAGVVELPAANG